jgi:DNA-binding NarL/FixJ family response regulator
MRMVHYASKVFKRRRQVYKIVAMKQNVVTKVIEQQHYTVVIADDHNLVRDAVAEMLIADGGFSVSSVGDLPATFQALQTNDPIDMLLLDVSMPGMAGMGSIQQIVAKHPDLKIVLFSGSVSSEFVFQSLQAGVRGYVPKTLPLRSLTSALRLVLSGQVFLPMSLLSEVDGTPSFESRGDNQKILTAKEVNILNLVSDGKTNKEIAWALGASEVTVKMYLRTIFNKLGASNRTHAVMLAKAKSLL